MPETVKKNCCLEVEGTVQGVGFRPFVYSIARSLDLTGWVCNTDRGATLEVEGPEGRISEFLERLDGDKPPHCTIKIIKKDIRSPTGYGDFVIRPSVTRGQRNAVILADLASCADCIDEVFDPRDRRYLYPFTNCTHCGPRYTIIEAIPYDRGNTTMSSFAMCRDCESEYRNPLDRRFHAQPIACPACGPQIELRNRQGVTRARRHDALLAAAEAVREGKIVALKGLGGFQLIADARNDHAIGLLRRRKMRPHKPLALMFRSLSAIGQYCQINEQETALLSSQAAPIVLVRRRSLQNSKGTAEPLSRLVAPGNPFLGVFLPTTPLHHILLRQLDFPVVATSGNRSNEPICINEENALEQLGAIADLFLVHNRPIKRPVDDSVARIINRRIMMLRRARGYAPLPFESTEDLPSILAVGPHLKNTVAISRGSQIILSQHIGDLETLPARKCFAQTIDDLGALTGVQPQNVACDEHPDYFSTAYAQRLGLPLRRIQHHYAHIIAAMAEHDLDQGLLGVSWDGTGWGPDKTIWGGEFLWIGNDGYRRLAHLRPFCLPGGEKAIVEPRRSALGLLFESYGERIFIDRPWRQFLDFADAELKILQSMLKRRVNCPATSSIGRLFDAVSALLGLSQEVSFEGQAAMNLEYAAAGCDRRERYPIDWILGTNITPMMLDWSALLQGIVDDLVADIAVGSIANKFHNTLAAATESFAAALGVRTVVLSGGCFQNKTLLERTAGLLEVRGVNCYWPQQFPANDGGIALGQLIAACRDLKKKG